MSQNNSNMSNNSPIIPRIMPNNQYTNNRNISIKKTENEYNERNRNHHGSFNRNYSNTINNKENRNLPMINSNKSSNNNLRTNNGGVNSYLHYSHVNDQQENKNVNLNNIGSSNRINGGYNNYNNNMNEPTKILYHHNHNSPSLNELPKSLKSPLNDTTNKITNNNHNMNEYNPYNNNSNIPRSNSKNTSAVSRSSSRNQLSKENLNINQQINFNTNSPYINSSAKSPIITTTSTKNNYNDITYNNDTDVLKYDISKKLVGLENLGNTCFMNTSLQCILHCDSFIKRFLYYCENTKPVRPIPICNAFLDLIEKYSKKSDKSSISPNDLKSQIGRKHRCYAGYSQQDSQEFIRKLLDEISKELNKVTTKPPYRMLNPNNEKKSKMELDEEYDNIFRERENSIVIDTFYGQSVSIFECMECNYESFSFCKFLDLPLLLEERNSEQDLFSLIKKHFQSEKIQWESPCENKSCGRKTMHRKRLKLTNLPDILILSFQRYSNRLNKKNNSKISFKNELDLSDYTDSIYSSGILKTLNKKF